MLKDVVFCCSSTTAEILLPPTRNSARMSVVLVRRRVDNVRQEMFSGRGLGLCSRY
jgi:hypothetical protein